MLVLMVILLAFVVLSLILYISCMLCPRLADAIWGFLSAPPPENRRPPGNRRQLRNRRRKVDCIILVYDTYKKERSAAGEEVDGGCAICLDEYANGERRATVAPCNHRFHAFCIEAAPPPENRRRKVDCIILVYDTYKKERSAAGEEVDGGCAICLNEYTNGELRATVAPCNHRFHAFCIKAWVANNSTCPLCRHDLCLKIIIVV
ncbi:hypothetical protein C2S52_009947 [Perilla frutescens var. hirtella]|nr:hypothetical protein C2S52_009947 [Perilla frutescens var. hirtella]